MSPAEKLVELRGTKTQKEVAENIGITTTALCNYERGIRIPRDSVKKKLAEYYQKTVDYIFF